MGTLVTSPRCIFAIQAWNASRQKKLYEIRITIGQSPECRRDRATSPRGNDSVPASLSGTRLETPVARPQLHQNNFKRGTKWNVRTACARGLREIVEPGNRTPDSTKACLQSGFPNRLKIDSRLKMEISLDSIDVERRPMGADRAGAVGQSRRSR